MASTYLLLTIDRKGGGGGIIFRKLTPLHHLAPQKLFSSHLCAENFISSKTHVVKTFRRTNRDDANKPGTGELNKADIVNEKENGSKISETNKENAETNFIDMLATREWLANRAK